MNSGELYTITRQASLNYLSQSSRDRKRDRACPAGLLTRLLQSIHKHNKLESAIQRFTMKIAHRNSS